MWALLIDVTGDFGDRYHAPHSVEELVLRPALGVRVSHHPKPWLKRLCPDHIADASSFRFAKFFGSGVIIATAFIHLLAPAFEALGSPCLSGAWTDYVRYLLDE